MSSEIVKLSIQLDFYHKIAEEMEREKTIDSGARQDRYLPEPEPEKSDLPVFSRGRTLKEMLASGKEGYSLEISRVFQSK